MKRRSWWAVLAALVFLSAACRSTNKVEEQWRTIEVLAPSDRVVWQLTLLAMQNMGYPRGPTSDSRSSAREVESGWKTNLQPFRGEGTRKRVLLRLTPLGPGRWKLEARVKRENNQNLVAPLDPTRAEWEPAADDQASAQVLLMHIRSRLAPELEIGPDPPG